MNEANHGKSQFDFVYIKFIFDNWGKKSNPNWHILELLRGERSEYGKHLVSASCLYL